MNKRIFRIAAIALATISAGAAVAKAPTSLADLSLKGIGLNYSRDDREAADAEMLRASIPDGTPLAQAQSTLRHKGARCKAANGGGLDCVYTAFDVVDDYLHDVRTDIRVGSNAGAVDGITVHRASYGS